MLVTPRNFISSWAVVGILIGLVAGPLQAADPAAKELKQAGRAVDKLVRQESASQLKDLKSELKTLLAEVASSTKTPTDALGDAVLATAEAAAAVSTAAFDGVVSVRDDAVDAALGGSEGAVLLGRDFQAGGHGTWDDILSRLHASMGRLDAKLSKALWKFVIRLEKASSKLGNETDVHLQIQEHDRRIDAVQCPASLAANPGLEASADVPILQVHIEARIINIDDTFTSQIGIRGFGNAMANLEYVTSMGTTPVVDIPMLPSGVALNTQMMGNRSIGPYRVDVVDPVSGERMDSAGGRPPSTTSASGGDVKPIVKQAVKSMRLDSKFYGQVTGDVLKSYRKADSQTCKDHAKGDLGTEDALDQLFSNHRDALANTSFWQGIVLSNPVLFAQSELSDLEVADEDIPDDLAADAGGAFTKHNEKVNRRTAQRGRSFMKLGMKSIYRIVKKATKDGENVAVNAIFGRGRTNQGPTVSTFDSAVVQLNVTPHITAAGTITLEISPGVIESTAIIIGQTPTSDLGFDLTQVNLADGQTTVIDGLMSSVSDGTFKEKIPFFSNLPLVGRLFKSGPNEDADTDLLVLVTAMILPGNN